MTFKLPSGKQEFIRTATLEFDIKFDLWKNYTDWIEPAQRHNLWYPEDVLKHQGVMVEISLGTETVLTHIFSNFETVNMHYVFDDMTADNCDLLIRISNLSSLPIRDDTGEFVCGMVQIQSVKLQGINITHILDNSMFGVDSTVLLPMSKPIYSWMVKNQSTILPAVFNLPFTSLFDK